MAYADERGRREYYSNPINTGRVPDSVRFAQEAGERRNESLNQTNNSNPFGDWLNRNYPTYTGSRDPDTFYNNRENSYINWTGSQSNGQQSDMLFPTDWGGTTIGPKEEQEEPQQPQEEPQQPQEEPQDNPISAPKPITPQKAEEPLPEEPVDTGASSRGVELPAPVEPVVPTADQGGRDAGAAFRRAVDRGNRSDDESEFWSGNPLFPTDYGGTTIPGMPGTSVPKPSPVTRDQFLEGASNFLSPLMNFGVPTATGESEYTPRPYNEDARRAVEVDRALRSLGTIPGNVQGYMNDNGLEPSWLLTPAGREMLNDMPNSPLNAGAAEPTAGVNSFTDASVRPGNPESFNNKVNNIADFLSNNVIPGLQTPDWFTSPLIQNVADNVGNDVGEYVGRYADVVRDYNNDLSDIPSQNPYDTITPVPAETPFEPAPPSPEVEPVDLSTTEQSYTPQDTSNPVNNPSTTGTRYNPYANMSTYDETADRLAREQYNRSTRSNTAYDNPFMSNSVLGNESFNIADPFAPVISQNDMKDIQDAFNSLPDTMTDWQKREFMWKAYNDPYNFKPDPGFIAGMEAPQLDENGVPNYTLTLLMNTKDYLADDGTQLEVGNDGQFYKPGDNKPVDPSTVTAVPHYDADTVFQTFVDLPKTAAMKDGGQVVWKQPIQDLLNDPTLTQEERDGLNALLVSKFWAGTEVRGREFYDRQFFDGTDAQYNHLAQLFVDKLGLTGLLNSGVMSVNDVKNFFFKAPRSEAGNKPKPGSGSGSGSGRGYGGGGYSGYGGRGSGGYSGNSGYNGYVPSSSSSNQRQNRVYNIMKNWSF